LKIVNVKINLKLSFRALIKKPTYTIINIVGLILGTVSFFLILEYVFFEKSFDSFHHNSNQIFRVGFNWGEIDQLGDNSSIYASNVPAMGPALVNEIPDVLLFTRLFDVKIASSLSVITYYNKGEVKYTGNEENGAYADSNFFKIFTFPIVSGIENPLSKPNSIVLSEKLALKIFGETDYDQIVGSMLQYDNRTSENYMVTGIMKNMPVNSHLQFDFLVSYSTINSNDAPHTSWWWSQFHTYIKCVENTTNEKLKQKFVDLIHRHYGEKSRISIFIQPLEEIYLNSNLRSEIGPTGSSTRVSILLGVAFLILLSAWINYFNLFSSRSSERANEIGIKKVFGAERLNIVFQFLRESFVINLVSILLSIIVLVFVQERVSTWLNKDLSSIILENYDFVFLIIIGLLIGVFISILYPSLVLASKNPLEVLGKKFKSSSENYKFQEFLIYVQFVISFVLISCTLIIVSQIEFLQKYDKGIDLNGCIVFRNPANYVEGAEEKVSTLINELLKYSIIENASFSNSIPGKNITFNAGFNTIGDTNKDGNSASKIDVGQCFLATYGIQLIEGRNFSSKFSGETDKLIVNESALKVLHIFSPKDAINRRVIFCNNEYTIIGVFKDYNHLLLEKAFEPILLNYSANPSGYFTIKVNDNDKIQDALAITKKELAKVFPDRPFEYEYASNIYDKQYVEIRKFSFLMKCLSILAILVSALGSFALAGYSSQKELKSTVIRKILGATVIDTLFSLFKGFGIRLILSSIIGTTITYFLMQHWLQNFAVAIELGIGNFLIAFIVLLIVLIISVAYDFIRLSIIKPIYFLKDE
jgi:putative ABC transport system permease protein